MDFIAMISNVANAIGQVFGFQSKKLDLKNTPEMQQAAKAQGEADAKAKTDKAIENRDTEEIRKELAE